MKAVLCTEVGPPEKLTLQEVDDLTPAAGQVRIAIEACGCNFPDTLIIEGKYQFKPDLPFSPGGEVAGVIDAVGEGMSADRIGESVIAMVPFGGYAEQMVIEQDKLLPRPSGMDGKTAAGFAMTYGTSMHALKQRAELKAGETLLVLGAGGGVGLAAVELGKLMGARVIAAASSDAKLAAAKAAGADELINYSETPLRDAIKEMTKGRGVDVVYDPVGGEMFELALRSTAWRGRVLVVGFASGDIPKVPVNLMLLKGCAVVGVFWGAFRGKELALDNENFAQMFEWYAAGKLNPHISKAYALKDAALALNDLKERCAIGKIVLTTGDTDE
ncbi:MAG: NADPH:quinone oxidoreductase family protein [OCS116 cluster bacterium]|nr:NADPH:quinone oxidoreductase family protein [OCS116 cluster bacterium]